jgi:hypothetical protein
VIAKREVKKLLGNILISYNFLPNGNYFRRHVGGSKQALYLQPSKYGGEYFVVMLITYDDISMTRLNTIDDAHLSARLSSYYNPKGDPICNNEWTLRYGDSVEANLNELKDAVGVFLSWLDQYPSSAIAFEKMHNLHHAQYILRYRLFEDFGMTVPMPS